MATRILLKEIRKLSEELEENSGFMARPKEDNMMEWNASVVGPDEYPYQGGQFELTLHFSFDFPLRPPRVHFSTRIFHPNVDTCGNVCAHFLKEQWKPFFSISYILSAITSLLLYPNTDNPVSNRIADMYLNNRETFEVMAREFTFKYARKT